MATSTTSFIARRLALGLLVLATVAVLLCVALFSAPVDPAQLTFGQRIDESSLEKKRIELGLDQSVWNRTSLYLKGIIPIRLGSGDEWTQGVSLGKSYQSGVAVAVLLRQAIPSTVILAVLALLLAMLIGVPLGVLAARNAGGMLDNVILTISTIGISVPSYVSSMIAALLFGYVLRDWTGLPVQGGLFALDDMGDEYLAWSHVLLPALALGVRPVAVLTQLSRSAMIDVLSAEYIKTALSKGLALKSVIWQHAFPNSLNPVITSLTGWLASLLGGAFFVERVFSFRGVGDLTITALLNYDIPVVLACALFVSLLFVLVNMLADILYVVTSPTAALD